MSCTEASCALCLEAGMGVYYQQLAGEFFVAEVALTRSALTFPANPDGVCLHADLRGRFSWTLNGRSVVPRLLPLPLEDAALRAALTRLPYCER